MIGKQEIAAFVLAALNRRMDAILLRGTDPDARAGGDIDIVVPAARAAEAAVWVAEAAATAGWAVVGFRHLGYVAQICLIIPDTVGSDDTAIKIDLSDGLAWYALGDDPIGEAVFRFRTAGGSEAQAAALATFFQKILYPGYLRERDRDRVFTALSTEDLAAFCRAHGLPVSVEEIDAGRLKSATRWHLRAASANARGLKLLAWGANAAWSALRARTGLGTCAGQVIGVAGMDGSGKSTLVDRFVRAVTASEFTEPVLVHLLPDVIPMPHRIIRRKSTVNNYTRPYSEPPVRSRLNGRLRLCYYIAAFAATRLWCSAKTARGKTIVFDRSIVDFASDLARARIPHVQLPDWLLRTLQPSGLFYCIDAKPDTVVTRKGELTLERATELSQRYSAISKTMSLQCLDGERDVPSVFKAFLAAVTDEVLHRARRRAR